MSWEIELSVTVSVSSVEEAERFQNAVYSGLAGEILRLGVLYGQLPVPGSFAPRVSETKLQEQAVELTRLEDQPVSIKNLEPAPKREKKSGLGGRKRIGRV